MNPLRMEVRREGEVGEKSDDGLHQDKEIYPPKVRRARSRLPDNAQVTVSQIEKDRYGREGGSRFTIKGMPLGKFRKGN